MVGDISGGGWVVNTPGDEEDMTPLPPLIQGVHNYTFNTATQKKNKQNTSMRNIQLNK